MINNQKKGIGIMVLALALFLVLNASVPTNTALAVTCGSGKTFGPVDSLVLATNVFAPGGNALASGTIGGSCPTTGETVYWWYASVATSQNPAGAVSGSGTTAATSTSSFSFNFPAPSPPLNQQGFGNFVLYASLCAEGASCPTAITGVASTSFSSGTSSPPPTYTLTMTFVDSSSGAGIGGIGVVLYSGVGSTLTEIGSQTTTSSAPPGIVIFQGLPTASYTAVYTPGSSTVGSYPSGQQVVTVSSLSNSYRVTLTAETVTETSSSTSTTVITSLSTSTSTSVIGTSTSTSTGTTTIVSTSTTTCTSATPCGVSSPVSQTDLVVYGIPLVTFLGGLFVYRKKG